MAQQNGKTERDKGISSVHPSYLEGTRHRIAQIEKFLAGDRSRARLVETAEAIGLSPSRTGRLVRSYELHRDPKLISGDGRRHPRSASTHERDLGRHAIDDTIAALGTNADARAVEEAVVAACERVSINPPSTQLIWKSLARARRANRAPDPDASPKVLVGRVWFQLPVEIGPEKVERPEALIALRLPDKSIRAFITSLQCRAKPRLDDLLDTLTGNLDVHSTGIEVGSIDTAKFSFTVVSNDAAQNEFIRYLGNGIGELDVLLRRPRTDASSLLDKIFAKAMSVEAAEDAIKLAIERYESEIADNA